MSERMSDNRPAGAPPTPRLDFYREEFLKHRQCLERHREYYSERAILDVEQALARVIAELEHLCPEADADRVVSMLLRKFDVVTRLSAWTDPTRAH